MKTLLFALTTALLATPSSFAAPSAPASPPLSDTADIARYAPRSVPDGKLINDAMNHDFFTKGATYKGSLHLTGEIQTSAAGLVYRAVALMSDATGKLFYRKFDVTVGTKQGETARRALSVSILGDTDLSQMHFSISTGLEDRMVVVEDPADDVTLAFPLGVGGIDEAVMSPRYEILTPKFHNAFLQRKTVTVARTDPAYYRGRPFMPITDSRGDVTAVAFHITILDDDVAQQYGLNYLVRGFESHGCMRLREKDLMEFFTIVEKSADEKLPVTVDNHVWARNAQGARDPKAGPANLVNVYPSNNSSYMRVTYFPESPHYQRDNIPGEHLVIMDRANGQPDFRRLDLVNPAMDVFGEDETSFIDNRYPMP